MSRNVSGKLWDMAYRLFNAQNYFNQATDPELVDHAILSVQVAERKYMYWLKQIKNLE